MLPLVQMEQLSASNLGKPSARKSVNPPATELARLLELKLAMLSDSSLEKL